MNQALQVIDTPAGELPLSLELPPGLAFEEWVNLGRRLRQGQHAINWHIGDWWAFGDHRYGDRAEAAAKGIFGLEFQTLANLASIARAYEPSRRREVVSFTHHAEAAGLAPEVADNLLDRAARDHLSAKDIRREVQAIKAANDAPIGTVSAAAPVERKPKPEWPAIDILATKYVEAMEEISSLREMTKGEADFCAMIEQCLGEEYSDRKPVPDDFEIIFVEKGRPACEPHYGASRITISRWMHQTGYSRLIRERANFVKYQRDQQRAAEEAHQPVTSEIDSFLSVATMAADFLRTNRYGGWRISRQASGWIVGTVHRSSEELIAMAEKQGFDREAAVTEARQEGY